MTALPYRVAAFAAAMLLLPLAAHADDDNAAFSSAPSAMQLCGGEDALLKGDVCKDGSYATQATELDQALQAALAKVPANVRPLLKRDQYWFGETLLNAIQNGVPQSQQQTDRDAFKDMLRRRVAALRQIADGFGRPGLLGKWEDAFGSVTVTPAENGAYRLAIEADSGYVPLDYRHWRCQATALVKPSANGWLAGEIVPDAGKPGEGSAAKPTDSEAAPAKPLPIKIRRQGETLRVVATERYGDVDYAIPESCGQSEQITGSYFPSGRPDDATSDKSDTGFIAPTFDCARPNTASDEEICADPYLAGQDVRLNRAWKTLLPRLDEATRRALTEDQRNWVREQAGVFPESLHPGADKMTSELHHVSAARDDLDRLQRERIALLEGFDENRKGFLGLWLGYNAILNVTAAEDGRVQAKGRKWEWDDYKGGCDYDIRGKVVGGAFRSNEQRKNPDTLERDHATLVINRQDAAFARMRNGADGEDEEKCRRSQHASSTVRLFPLRSSPDVDPTGTWH
jgi:uncharacterized protein YecT (DUF1311 family)